MTRTLGPLRFDGRDRHGSRLLVPDEGCGVIWRRHPERQSATAPDYSGAATIEGKRYRVGLWVKADGKFCGLDFREIVPRDEDEG